MIPDPEILTQSCMVKYMIEHLYLQYIMKPHKIIQIILQITIFMQQIINLDFCQLKTIPPLTT
jgi:hypothetical protein